MWLIERESGTVGVQLLATLTNFNAAKLIGGGMMTNRGVLREIFFSSHEFSSLRWNYGGFLGENFQFSLSISLSFNN